MTLTFVYRSWGPDVNHCFIFAIQYLGSRKPLEIETWLQASKGPPMRNGLREIKWSLDRWRHVGPNGQIRDPYTLRALYLGDAIQQQSPNCRSAVRQGSTFTAFIISDTLASCSNPYDSYPFLKCWVCHMTIMGKRLLKICSFCLFAFWTSGAIIFCDKYLYMVTYLFLCIKYHVTSCL